MLSANQIESFKRDGYLSGIRIFDRQEIDRVRLKAHTLLRTPGLTGDPAVHRHLDDAETLGISCHQGLTEALSQLLGPDVVLWHSRYFDKAPGDPLIPWHQDAPYWNIEPSFTISAWVALDLADEENGCIHVIPGSHRSELKHLNYKGPGRFSKQVDPRCIREHESVPVLLEPGEVLLFDRWLVHRSGINKCHRPRLGLSLRYTRPDVRIFAERMSPPVPGYETLLVRGKR